MHITFIITGGTIFQKLDPITGQMVLGVRLDELLSPEWIQSNGITSYSVHDLAVRSGAELTYDTIFAARDAARKHAHGSKGLVLVTGTDTLEEFAFCLDLLLGQDLVAAGLPLVVTGAMKPYDIEGYDGRANIQQAVQVAINPQAGAFGVLVTLNDTVHCAHAVRKSDSQLMGAFTSHPGPVGQVRGGRVLFYYGPPPPSSQSPGAPQRSDPPFRDLRFAALTATAVRPWVRVGIWTTAVDAFIPQGLLATSHPAVTEAVVPQATGDTAGAAAATDSSNPGLSGLVLAAPGTGSLPGHLLQQLASATPSLPVALVSRCAQGHNYDEALYRGSQARYEAAGLMLAGFEGCNALQARHLLVMRLAAGVYHPRYGAPPAADSAAGGDAVMSAPSS